MFEPSDSISAQGHSLPIRWRVRYADADLLPGVTCCSDNGRLRHRRRARRDALATTAVFATGAPITPTLPTRPRLPARSIASIADSDNGVEVMGLCSNPSWLADLGKCGIKV